MENYHRVYAEINLDAILENIFAMRRQLPKQTKILGIVKADGYGHGLVPVACAIAPYVAGYGVATAEEALTLRRHGIKKPILVLGIVHKDWYREIIENEIRIPLFEKEKIEEFNAAAEKMGKKGILHLALDTGMSRIGMKPDALSADMVKEVSSLPGIFLEGLFTHFATADEKDKTKTLMQAKRYRQFCMQLKERGVVIPVRHCANSAGIIEDIGRDLEMVRAGISLYGMYPSDEVDKTAIRLKPALELKSYITFLKEIEPGAEVSYGGTFRAEEKRTVATIPVGYADGYPRNLSGKGWVLIRGKKAPILGRVCMDQFMVDVTDIHGVCEGDTVILIGKDGEEKISAEDLALAGRGFHYELVCCLGKRIPRIYQFQGKTAGKKDYFQEEYFILPEHRCRENQ